jgi:hypothetical protein
VRFVSDWLRSLGHEKSVGVFRSILVVTDLLDQQDKLVEKAFYSL